MAESSLRHRQSRAESSVDLLDNEYTQDDEHVEAVYQNPVRILRFLFYLLTILICYRKIETALSYC